MKKSQSSDYFNRLDKGLGIDKEGNVSVGKNLKVDGATKLNGGLEPIHTYEFDVDIRGESNHIIFNVFFEIEGIQGFTCIGSINNVNYDEGAYMGLCEYQINNDKLQFLKALYYYDSEEPYIELYDFTSEIPTYKMVETQPKLYAHALTLTAGTTDYVLMYDCSDNTPANTVQDLRTLMNITSASDSVILPVVKHTDLSTAGLQITTSVCKIGTADVTTITDNVTTL